MLAAKDRIRVPLDPSGVWEGYALLLGCREDLLTLKPGEYEKAVEVIKKVVREQDVALPLQRENGVFRAAVASEINVRIGRQVVSDVWLGLSRAEDF